MQNVEDRRLVRGPNRVLGGVCSGLAQYFSIDPLLVRVGFVLLALATGAGIVLYLLLWLLVPEVGEPPRQGDVLGAGLRSVERDLRRLLGAPPRPAAP
jgi:phage shock protein C